MGLNEFDTREILKLYDDGKSTYEIAELYKTYPNKINRIIKAAGRKLRDHSEAQKMALETGRTKNPFEGKTWSEEERQRIAKDMQERWGKLSHDELERIREEQRRRWESLSDEQKEEFKRLGHAACNATGRKGSQLELYLRDQLEFLGYPVIFHKRGAIINDALEVDLIVPVLKTAIEVNGPTHYKPIYGQERLTAQIQADQKKVGLLLHEGYTVIVLKCLYRKLSTRRKHEALSQVLLVLKKKELKKIEPYIEIEIK